MSGFTLPNELAVKLLNGLLEQEREALRAAEADVKTLRKALEGVAEDPKRAGVDAPLCWCGAWDYRPSDHSPECLFAHSALAAARKDP